MSQQRVQGVSQFRQFKPGNMIRVDLTDGEVLRGVYADTKKYNSQDSRVNWIKEGQYMIIYDVANKKPELVNILQYCRWKGVHIETVGGTRLPKSLSEYLRAYYKNYEKHQAIHKQVIAQLAKAEQHEEKMKEVSEKGIDKKTHEELAHELFKQNPFGIISQLFTEGPWYVSSDESKSQINLEKVFKSEGSGADIGASTYLEYDDSRFIDEEPDPDKVLELIQRVHPNASKYDYLYLVKKYRTMVEFSPTFYKAELRDGKGDRFMTSLYITITFKNIKKVTIPQVNALIKDLTDFTKDAMYESTRRNNYFW